MAPKPAVRAWFMCGPTFAGSELPYELRLNAQYAIIGCSQWSASTPACPLSWFAQPMTRHVDATCVR